jgi:hemerythrin superfamily protein
MKKHTIENEAVRMIRRDHKRVTDLMFHFEQSEDPNHKLSFAQTAINEIAVHSVIEEECIYPLLEAREKKKLLKKVHHSRQEHKEIDELMTELVNRDRYDEEYRTIFTQLAKRVNDHMKEEEHDLLPVLNKIATEDLAEKMSALKNELLAYEAGSDKDFSPQVVLFEKLRTRRSA